MDYNQNNQPPQYQPGYAPYQGQASEPMVSPQPYAQQPYAQQPYAQQPYAQEPYAANKPADVPEQSYEYTVRKGFIVKTYGILLTQLGITCLFIAFTFIPGISDYVTRDLIQKPIILVFLIVFIIVTIVVCIVFSCCRETA